MSERLLIHRKKSLEDFKVSEPRSGCAAQMKSNIGTFFQHSLLLLYSLSRMKNKKYMVLKKIVVWLSFTVFIWQSSTAQLDVSAHPFNIIGEQALVGIDFSLSDHFSVELLTGLGFKNRADYNSTSIPADFLAKYYFTPEERADKFYAAALLHLRQEFNQNDNRYIRGYDYTEVGAGLVLGYKIVSSHGIIMEMSFGLARNFVNQMNQKSIDEGVDIFFEDLREEEIYLHVRFGLGYRFGGKMDTEAKID